MAQTIEQLFSELGIWAIPASLLLNGILNMVGFIPSVFVTTANVLIWGLRGAHPVVAGVASVYVKGVLGRQTNLSCW